MPRKQVTSRKSALNRSSSCQKSIKKHQKASHLKLQSCGIGLEGASLWNCLEMASAMCRVWHTLRANSRPCESIDSSQRATTTFRGPRSRANGTRNLAGTWLEVQ